MLVYSQFFSCFFHKCLPSCIHKFFPCSFLVHSFLSVLQCSMRLFPNFYLEVFYSVFTKFWGPWPWLLWCLFHSRLIYMGLKTKKSSNCNMNLLSILQLLSQKPKIKKNSPAVFSVKIHKSQSLPDDDFNQQKNIIKTTLTFQFLIYLSFYDISLIYPSNLTNQTISKIK